jgi:arylformamidase
MSPEVREFLRGLGEELSPAMIEATQRFFAARCTGIHPGTVISRDHRYGPDERHRLDVFGVEGRRDAPVLLFVHGGGFVRGDKRSPDLPFYDNVGDFAVQAGCVGVTMTYRLAPAHPWPAGSEDVAAAVQWLRAHIAGHGGDPRRIFLMGQSAGAVHVAGCIAQGAARAGSGVAGALLLSGSYDVARADANPFHLAYYGEDAAAWPARSTLEALCATDLPLLVTICEFDGADFQQQAALLVAGYVRARRRFPPLHWLAGHNHLSPVLAIGSPADTLGPLIRDFIAMAG